MADQIIAGLDIETTGLEQAEGHRIIEVAMVLYDLDTRRERGRFEARINPLRGIDPKAQAIHGISSEDLVGCPQWEAVAPKVAALLKHCTYVVAHNGIGFDAPFLAGELMRVGLEAPSVPVTDTMLQGRWATPDGSIPNLEALCFACAVPYDRAKAHRATYDVECMMACLFKQLPRGFFALSAEPFVWAPPAAKKK